MLPNKATVFTYSGTLPFSTVEILVSAGRTSQTMADLYPPYMPSSSSSDDAHDNQKDAPPKPDTKPQATFLTKLYALVSARRSRRR